MSNLLSKTWLVVLIIILVIAGLCAMVGVGNYNSLLTTSQNVDRQWAQVETQYQRRFDLVPNLVASVKGIMEQEKDVFGKLADARAKYAGARTTDEKVTAAGEYDSAISRLLVISENYPQLKSSESVNALMIQLEGTENRISVERGRYNDTVNEYNVAVKSFPKNIFASIFGYKEKPYYESDLGADKAPAVKF